MENAAELRESATRAWVASRREEAIHTAWAAYRLEPQNIASKTLLASVLRRFPTVLDSRKRPWNIDPEMRTDLLHMLEDQDFDPDYLTTAGWFLAAGDAFKGSKTDSGDFGIAERLDGDELCLALLKNSPVQLIEAERILTKVRKWLLLSGQGQRYPRLLDALVTQATLNGGAWPFDDAERVAFENAAGQSMLSAYLPLRDSSAAERDGDSKKESVTAVVAKDYERWPYPVWQRIMARPARRLPDEIKALDPNGPDCIPIDAKILNAGCGTGREVASIAFNYPDARITAIDVSEASLSYARAQCAKLAIRNIRFLKLDLNRASELNERYDAVFSSGVIHHLPDPEQGLASLASVLRPGGVMRIAVYSSVGYPNINADPALIKDLVSGPVSDDMLRQVRRRLMQRPDSKVAQSIMRMTDFSTLAGLRDLVLHTQVHLFDIPRIARALESLGLRLLSLAPNRADARARYHAMFPHDSMFRDLESISKFEQREPETFRDMYGFWCRSAAAASV